MNSQPSFPKAELAALCRTHGIRRLALFGSALRADFGAQSDIDALVEFVPGRIPGSTWKPFGKRCRRTSRN